MKIVKRFIKEKGIYAFFSFVIPLVIMGFAYAHVQVGPTQDYTILASDSYSQYANFFANFNQMIKEGNSLFYNWYGSLGINNIAFMAYYLNGLFTPLVLFFDNAQIADFVYYLTLLKFGCLGLSFWIYAANTFKVKKWQHLLMAISYALMSYMLAYSEIVMWFDGLIYLPLAVLGINRILEQRKPLLLFISYFLVFVSNFYMAFMIGVFTFLYALVRYFVDEKREKKNLFMYIWTSLLAGGASMPIIIPTVLDISSNGEALSPINRFFTVTTGPLDILAKNMVGIYDSTKTETIPFIYVGQLMLVFAIFFFVSPKVSKKLKIGYGLLMSFVFISFYVEILDLLWQGLHTPNMFLFRYSFTFSFMILMIAGYGIEQYKQQERKVLTKIIICIGGLFILTKIVSRFFANQYDYVYIQNLFLTLAVLVVYLLIFNVKKLDKLSPVLFILMVSMELGTNSALILRGIDLEWVYPDKYTVNDSYEELKTLVDYTKSENPNHFYRMENLTAPTINESMKYGYSGINFFSSIRNRHSSQYLADLGFYSAGTNLTIRYDNNTLLMDSLLGIKYNLTNQKEALKFGYKPIKTAGDYTLFENTNLLPLGILTDDYIYEEEAVNSQVKLINHLAQKEENQPMFTFGEADLTKMKKTKLTEEKKNETIVQSFAPVDEKEDLTLHYRVKVPAKTQAYLTIYSVGDYNLDGSPYQTIEVNGSAYSSPAGVSGRYLSLGYYETETEVDITYTIHFFTDEEELDKVLKIVKPDVAFLDTDIFESTIQSIQANGVDLEIKGRKAQTSLALAEDRVLMTTIPYDKGWKAYIDGEEVDIPTFKDAFLAIPVTKGNHTLELVYFPYGMKLGLGISGGSVLLFVGSLVLQRKKRRNKFKEKKMNQIRTENVETFDQQLSKEDKQDIALIQKNHRQSKQESTAILNEKDDSLVTEFHFEKEDDFFQFRAEIDSEKKEE